MLRAINCFRLTYLQAKSFQYNKNSKRKRGQKYKLTNKGPLLWKMKKAIEENDNEKEFVGTRPWEDSEKELSENTNCKLAKKTQQNFILSYFCPIIHFSGFLQSMWQLFIKFEHFKHKSRIKWWNRIFGRWSLSRFHIYTKRCG